jgi:hypothetical protein
MKAVLISYKNPPTRRFAMARIIIVDGPKKFKGREISLEKNTGIIQKIFEELTIERCFWKIETTGLEREAIYEIKIMDFSYRCARSIMMNIPIYFDGSRMNAKPPGSSIEGVLRTITNYMKVSERNLLIAIDNRTELRIEFVKDKNPHFGVMDFIARA